MVAVVGYDIGGANTKAVFLRTENGSVVKLKTIVEHFPVWKNPENLVEVLSVLNEKVSGKEKVDGIGLTMTAELSDIYQTKRQGVVHVLECAQKAFSDLPVFVLDVDATLRSMNAARSEPLKIAAANWAATGWLVAQFIKNCVVIDVGSTSTSIIPVIDGCVSAIGKTDLKKLIVGELVYTGSLRTNVAAIVNFVPLLGGEAGVSSELFAQSGDVHLVLGNISETDYTTETADGRGKTRREALARLARIVCADSEMLGEEEIEGIAQYVYGKQIEQIAYRLKQVYSRVKSLTDFEVPVVVTGLGRTFLAGAAARKIGISEILELEKLCLGDAFVYKMTQQLLLHGGVAMASPAFGVALMAVGKLERRLML